MQTSQLVTQLLFVAVQAAALYILSRLLFLWVMQAFASRRPRSGGGKLLQLLRLPGNLIHETAHAVGYLICGYRVHRVVPCIFDAEGRGSCEPGRPWSPLAVPWLATGVAALLPLVLGTVVLRALVQALGIELQPLQFTADNMGSLLIANISTTIKGLDWSTWQTYLFLYLAFSIGAELAPSDLDLRHSLPAILVAAAGFALMIMGFSRLEMHAPARIWFESNLGHGIAWLSALLEFGILATLIAGAITILPATVVRVLRSH